MSDRLALSVGKIILAWGRLDQQLHVAIRGLEGALGENHSIEGRFAERRKIFRRLCMRLVRNDKQFERRFDKACANLVALERKRGRIAHGYAGAVKDSTLFLQFPEVMANLRPPEEMLLENSFTFDDLERLEGKINECSKTLIILALDALALWQQ